MFENIEKIKLTLQQLNEGRTIIKNLLYSRGDYFYVLDFTINNIIIMIDSGYIIPHKMFYNKKENIEVKLKINGFTVRKYANDDNLIVNIFDYLLSYELTKCEIQKLIHQI